MAKGKKSRRNREWESDLKKNWENYGQNNDLPPQDFNDLIDWLRLYTSDLASWGQDVRDDIVRLESAIGLAQGDPGDPPAGPPD